jgi:hypothetical protein
MAALTPATRLENGRWSKGIRNIGLEAFVELALNFSGPTRQCISACMGGAMRHATTIPLPSTVWGDRPCASPSCQRCWWLKQDG